ELKRNIKEAWWQDMVRNPPLGPEGQEISMVGVDCSLIMNPKVWQASGHVGGFADWMVDCKKCRERYRADKVFLSGLFNIMETEDSSDSARPMAILGFEANDHQEARKLAEAEVERLVKKKRLPEIAKIREIAPVSACEPSWKKPCPAPGCDGELTEPRQFNLMFETYVGAVRDEENKAYLRPETAQGIFANFKN